jgi:hypothetical protein
MQARTILYSFKKHGLKDALKLKAASERSWVEILRNTRLPKA